MNWTDLVARVAERSGVSKAQARRVLGALVEESTERLCAGDSVVLKDLVVLGSRWREPTSVRSVADRRKLRLDGRWVPTARVSGRLREALAARTPQTWRDPEHQAAWRTAETLVGDLVLYHSDNAPARLDPRATPAEVEAACAASFGPLWGRVRATYQARVPEHVRAHTDHLALSARSRWASPARTSNRPSPPQE